MVLTERTRQGINEQLMREMQAFYAYLSMADYCESVGFLGFAKWLRNQSQEEWGHAMKFRSFILDRGERVQLDTIQAPEAEFSSVTEIFERALDNEQAVTWAINDLYLLAEQEKDFATRAFLNWFVLEQVEEERTVKGILDWLKRIGGSEEGLYLLDRELGGGVESGAGAGSADTTPEAAG
jgi:ferritin